VRNTFNFEKVIDFCEEFVEIELWAKILIRIPELKNIESSLA
jgi:hypothetical protein